MESLSEVKALLAVEARRLGFAHCGVTTADPATHRDFFRNWLAEGRHASMAWLERGAEKRCDLQLVLPGAQSLVVLATNYYQNEAAPAQGRVARYAWGKDYHDVLEPRLRVLSDFLTLRGGVQKHYTDTGPVLERDFAARAGIGWQGKSTMVLNRELGTWFFLSVVLTTLPLPPDAPATNHCGSCTRCIDACPTAAIIAPHQLDARRCLSYLTIENKGSIPVEFRKALGDRIYGCDECLDVCPWNRFAKVSSDVAFAMLPESRPENLRDYLAWEDNTFRRVFRGSPIKRIKRRGFLRNVCVALGNVGNQEDLPALALAVQDPEPLIAEHAEWAMQQISSRTSGAT